MILVYLYSSICGVLWLSVFGYLLFLLILSRKPQSSGVATDDWPEIAIVVPTLNEEQYIQEKLANLSTLDYPDHCVQIAIVDGGSTDRTSDHVRQAMTPSADITFIHLPDAKRKIDQVNHALSSLTHEFVILTDADTRLSPSSVKELVRSLQEDEETAVVGALVVPETTLLEEQIHWNCLNTLWWLEGEALGASGFSGVCYAIRRSRMAPLPSDTTTEDIHLAITTAARGHKVRLCRAAQAVEIRSPKSLRELLQFRKRRGTAYLTELKRLAGMPGTPWSWKLAMTCKIWHFTKAPWLTLIMLAMSVPLALTPYWPFVAGALLLMAIPWLAILAILNHRLFRQAGWIATSVAMISYSLVTFGSLFTLRSRSRLQSALGGHTDCNSSQPRE